MREFSDSRDFIKPLAFTSLPPSEGGVSALAHYFLENRIFLMTSRINQYLKKSRRSSDSAVEELILDGLKLKSLISEDVDTLKDHADALKSLSMNQCSLVSLFGLPLFPHLKTLELHDNRLSGEDVFCEIVAKCPSLEELMMAGNKVASVDALRPLIALNTLKELDLDMNPLMSKVQRSAIFDLIPSLLVVNNYTKDGQEVMSEVSADQEDGEDDENGDVGNKNGKSLLASLITGDLEDDDDDLEDYDPESDDYDSENSIISASGEKVECADEDAKM